MKKASWVKRIREATENAGTYRPFFDDVIDALALILEQRDEAQKQFAESGGQTVVEHTNQAGATNAVKNPAYVVIMECNTQALAYWRDLGLTPKGLKAISEEAMKPQKVDALAEVLKELA